MFRAAFLLCIVLLYLTTAYSQEVHPCDHRYGAVASWSQSTDVLVPASRYVAEMWGFKYNLALTVFDSPFSTLTTTDKVECSKTGRLSWEVYFQTDRWAKSDMYEYPKDYRYYDESIFPLIPDYSMTEWTEVGKHYFPMVIIGEKKSFRYPNHGQELYDVSFGKYGYDTKTGRTGEIDVVSSLVDYHRKWVKDISGRYPSCFSYRHGEQGVRYAMKTWFLAGRNSSFNAAGQSRTAYGRSAITGKYLGYPDFFVMNHDETIYQASSTRWWDSWNTLLGTPQFKSRAEAVSNCETILRNTIANGGWYNDFTHWHNTSGDDLDVFYASQRNIMGDSDVFTGNYGDVMQHLFLRDAVKSSSTSWNGETCIIQIIADDSLASLPLDVFSIPLSVQIDLSNTTLSGRDITSSDSPGIRKLEKDLFVVEVPIIRNTEFHTIHIEPTDTPHYLDFGLPTILSITAKDKTLTVKTDKPTRLALFWTTLGAPEYTVTILCRSNDLKTVHTIDFNNPSVLLYGGPRTWTDIKNGDIYIGAITETRQSVLYHVYHYFGTSTAESQEETSQFFLSQNYPNPFNMSTFIQYIIPEKTHVMLQVYNINGQKIKTLVDLIVLPGRYIVNWDGTDERGASVSSGLYYCSLQAEKSRIVRNLVLIK